MVLLKTPFCVHGAQFDVGQREKWTIILRSELLSLGQRLGQRTLSRGTASAPVAIASQGKGLLNFFLPDLGLISTI